MCRLEGSSPVQLRRLPGDLRRGRRCIAAAVVPHGGAHVGLPRAGRKYAPSKDNEKGDCPAPIICVAMASHGAGSALSNAALCLKGAAWVCNILAAGLKCINHAEGVRAGLDAASRPTLIFVTSLPQLIDVLYY